MIECPEFPHAYDNPSSLTSLVRGNRVPGYTHHRTSSNVSNTSTSSNVNPAFHLEDDTEYSPYSPTHYYQRTIPSATFSYAAQEFPPSPHPYISRQNSQETGPGPGERPSNLEVVTRLRSSLKKANYTYQSPNKSTSKNNSGSGTPTNHTPPDSLTSEDSSYVSAKDSQISSSRVRFSPVTFDRELPREHFENAQAQETITSPMQTSRRLSRNRKPSISELEREFLS